MFWRNRWLHFGLILSLAFLARLLFGDTFNLEGDDLEYYNASQTILNSGNPFAAAAHYKTHYCFRWLGIWLSTVQWHFFGDSLLSLAFFHLLAGVGLVALTLFYCRDLVDGQGARLSMLVAALIPVGIQVSLGVNPDQLLALFTATTFLLLIRAKQMSQDHWRGYVLAGLVFCLSTLTKEESGQHLLPLLAVVFFQNFRPWRWQRLLLMTAAFLLPITASYLAQLLWNSVYVGDPFAQFKAIDEAYAMWQRMAPTDPEGNAWSYFYFIRRLFFPFGPFAFIFPLSLIGGVLYWRAGHDRALLVWMLAQAVLMLVVGEKGFGQDRRLQLWIPACSMLAGLALWQLWQRKITGQLICAVMLLALVYINLGKYHLRSDTAPRAAAVAQEVSKGHWQPLYLHATISYYLRHLNLAVAHRPLEALATENSPSAIAVIRRDIVPSGWQVQEVLFAATEKDNLLNRAMAHLRRQRKEYAPYQVVRLQPLAATAY